MSRPARGPEGARVLILGGGAAGLSAAWFLREHGIRRITVLEREPRVGGKCRSVVVGDQLVEMGAIDVFSCYRNVRAFLKRFGLRTEPLGSYHLTDASTGRPAPLSRIRNGVGAVRLLSAVARFQRERRRVAPSVDAPLGFRGLTSDLCQPFAAWLRGRSLAVLEPLFRIPVANFGYGLLDEIPAAYALRYMRAGMLDDFLAFGLGNTTAIQGLPRSGYQGLMQALADDLARDAPDVRVVTSATDARIERGAEIRLALGDAPAEPYDALLLTTADLRDLEPTLSLAPREREVLARVRFRNYATVLARVEGVPAGGLGCGTPADGPLMQVFRPSADRDLAVLYCYHRDEGVPLDRLVDGAEQALRARGARLIRVLEASAWRYFPHFDGDALREGLVDRLRELHHNDLRTWYAGSLLGFETVEEVMAVSRHVAGEMAATLKPAATRRTP